MLADDHPAVQAGLRELLEATPDMRVVGEAEDGEVAVELVDALRPDLMVMDIHMPRLSGIACDPPSSQQGRSSRASRDRHSRRRLPARQGAMTSA